MQLQDWKLGLLTSVDNNLSVKYSPKIFSWITTNLSYTAGFKYGFNRQQKLAPRSATQSRTMQANGNLNLGTFAKAIYRPGTGKGRTGRPPAGRPAPGAKPGDNEKSENKKKLNFSVLGIFSGFMNLFEPFSINYNNRDNYTTYGIKGMPKRDFQFGLNKDPGVGLEEAITGGDGASGTNFNRGSKGNNITTSVSSGVRFGRNLSFRLKYDNSSSLNSNGKTTTGQRSESWLTLGKMDMMFPGWTATMSGLEKLPLVSKYFQRVSLDHNFAGRSNQTFEVVNKKENMTKEDKDANFRPLIGITMSMKNGISMTVRYNTSEKILYNRSISNSVKRTLNSDISVTANYSKRSDFRIPLPFLRNKRLKNNVDISLTFTSGGNRQEDSINDKPFVVKSETSKWLLKPDINYSFSDRVRGGMFFEVGKTHNKMLGDTSYKEFGINVNIAIRGN